MSAEDERGWNRLRGGTGAGKMVDILDWRLVLVVKRNVESTCTQPLAFSIYFLSTFTEPVRTGLFARTGCDSGARSQEPGFL